MSSPSGSPQVADGVSNPMAHTFDELERNYDSPDQRGSMSAIETEEHAGSDTNHMIDELDGRDEGVDERDSPSTPGKGKRAGSPSIANLSPDAKRWKDEDNNDNRASDSPRNPGFFDASRENFKDLSRFEYQSHPVPEEGARASKHKKSACWDFDVDLHWGYRNIFNFLTANPLPWWTDKWPIDNRHPSTEPSALRQRALEAYAKYKIPGLTLMTGLEPGDVSNARITALLRFRNTKECLSWVDSQLADIIGPYVSTMVAHESKKGSGRAVKRWMDVFHRLTTIKSHPDLDAIFSYVSSPQCRHQQPWMIRKGDMGLGSDLEEMKIPAYEESCLITALNILKFATVEGDNQNSASRFDYDGEDPSRYYGYTADDWLRALAAIVAFRTRRRGSTILDGHGGFRERLKDKSTVIYFTATEVERETLIITPEAFPLVEKLIATTQAAVLAGSLAPRNMKANKNKDKHVTKMTRQLNNRISFILANNTETSLTRHQMVLADRRKRAANRSHTIYTPIEPLHAKLLNLLLESMKHDRFTKEPLVFKEDETSEKCLEEFTSENTRRDFLRLQEGSLDNLAQVQSQYLGVDCSVAANQIYNDAKRQLIIAGLTKNLSAEDPDLYSVVEKLGVTKLRAQERDMDWENIHIPDTPFGTRLKTHQALDAAHLREAELSPLRGALLGNDVGTGKTMTVLALIAMGYFAQVKARDDGDTVNAEPSLIIVPASIVRQTFREIDSKFGDFFNVHVFHGGKSSTSEDAKIADATIGAQELEDLCLKWLEEKSSPETSKHIVLTSYDTVRSRLMKRHEHILSSTVDGVWIPRLDRLRWGPPEWRNQPTHGKYSTLDVNIRPWTGEDGDSGGMPDDADQTGGRDQHNLSKEEKKKASVRYYVMAFCRRPFTFARVIADEAQLLRFENSANSRMVRLLPKRALILVTATAALNRHDDIVGLAGLIAATSDMAKFDVPESVDLEFIAARNGFSPFTQPMRETGITLDQDRFDGEGDVDARRGATKMKKAVRKEFERVPQLRQWTKESGKRWWCLSPKALRKIETNTAAPPPTSNGSNVTRASDLIYRAAISCFVLKRDMNRTIEVPVGKAVLPSRFLPIVVIKMEELVPASQDQEFLADIVTEVTKTRRAVVLSEDDRPMIPSEDKDSKSRGPALSMALVRGLWIISMDLKLQRLLLVDDVTTALTPDKIQAQLAQINDEIAGYDAETIIQKMDDALRKYRDGPALGSRHARHIAINDPDGGLAYLHTLTNRDPMNAYPVGDRYAVVRWAAWESRVMHRALEIVLHNKLKKWRTLVVVNNPWFLQFAHAVFAKASFNVECIQSAHTSEQRDEAIRRFNDPLDDIDVLVINAGVSGAGLNLHEACTNGIILQFGWNWNSVWQVCGRLGRFHKDLRHVNWTILSVAGTYYSVAEDKMNRKYVEQLRNEVRFERQFSRHASYLGIQRLIAYEMLKLIAGQPYNRYSWVVAPPGHCMNYADERAKRTGDLCTKIAQQVMGGSEVEVTDDMLGKLNKNLMGICQSWSYNGLDAEEFELYNLDEYIKVSVENLEKIRIRPWWQESKSRPAFIENGEGLGDIANDELLSQDEDDDGTDTEEGINDAIDALRRDRRGGSDM